MEWECPNLGLDKVNMEDVLEVKVSRRRSKEWKIYVVLIKRDSVRLLHWKTLNSEIAVEYVDFMEKLRVEKGAKIGLGESNIEDVLEVQVERPMGEDWLVRIWWLDKSEERNSLYLLTSEVAAECVAFMKELAKSLGTGDKKGGMIEWFEIDWDSKDKVMEKIRNHIKYLLNKDPYNEKIRVYTKLRETLENWNLGVNDLVKVEELKQCLEPYIGVRKYKKPVWYDYDGGKAELEIPVTDWDSRDKVTKEIHNYREDLIVNIGASQEQNEEYTQLLKTLERRDFREYRSAGI